MGSCISLLGRKICGPEGKNPTNIIFYLSPLSIINQSLNESQHLQPRGGHGTRKPEDFSGPAVLGVHAPVPTSLQPTSIYGCHHEASNPDEVRMLIAVLLCWPNLTAA